MYYDLKLLPKAKENIKDAFDFYSQQKQDLANHFRIHLFETIDYLGNNPKLFSKRYQMIRETKISQFPFYIFFIIDEEARQIIILAVLKILEEKEN